MDVINFNKMHQTTERLGFFLSFTVLIIFNKSENEIFFNKTR